MSENITIEELTKLMEYGTLHGRIENWVLQTSRGNTQQLKIYSEESYRHNSENTCLRTRMRAIFSFAMSQYHPNVNPEFRTYIQQLYLSTIYLFPIGTFNFKTKYLNITFPSVYQIKEKASGTVLFSGPLSPRDVITFEELEAREFTLHCFRDENLIHEVDIKIVEDTFNVFQFYDILFALVKVLPIIATPQNGMVYASDEIPVSGYLEEL